MPVSLPDRQRAGQSQASGLLMSQVAADSSAEGGGLMVGDVIVTLVVTRNRGCGITRDAPSRQQGRCAVPITVIRGAAAVDVTVT